MWAQPGTVNGLGRADVEEVARHHRQHREVFVGRAAQPAPELARERAGARVGGEADQRHALDGFRVPQRRLDVGGAGGGSLRP